MLVKKKKKVWCWVMDAELPNKHQIPTTLPKIFILLSHYFSAQIAPVMLSEPTGRNQATYKDNSWHPCHCVFQQMRCANVTVLLVLPLWSMTLKKTHRVTAVPGNKFSARQFLQMFRLKSQSSQKACLPH